MTNLPLLPGVPAGYVHDRLTLAGGNEIGSGKLSHPESSAALAVNAFGWFTNQPALLPALPGSALAGSAEQVEVEFCARFPWRGGRHPWLDAVIFTATHLIGVESKRFEPFRDAKTASFSAAYDRPYWANRMTGYCELRDALRNSELRFSYLDAAQLVKHAYGLFAEGQRRQKQPVLFYLFAEPTSRADRPISPVDHQRHRDEIACFASAVAGDEVKFLSASYREWLTSWPSSGQVAEHGLALTECFSL